MDYEIRALSVPSTDNIHTLQGKIFIPNSEIKGLFHLVHGMTEYIDRYDHLFSFLAQNGYVCFGFDNLGHGKTVKDESELGFIAHNNGWKYLVNDVVTFCDTVKQMYPNLPITLMGHSMGSFITRLVFEHYSDKYQKIIICGTSGPNPLSKMGLIFAKFKKIINGERYISNTVYKLAFGSYNKNFEGNTDYEWLTKDQEIIEKYQNDKLCTFKFTLSAMIDLMKLLSLSNRKKWFENVNKATPVFLISGEDDPVGNYGNGVKTVFEKLTKAGVKTKLKLYPHCRHEIHNDTCKDEMFKDILEFIE